MTASGIYKKQFSLKVLLIGCMTALLMCEGYFGYQLHHLAEKQEQLKEDYAVLNNITFGVFSVDLWKNKIADIITGKIKTFKVTRDQKVLVRKQVERQLHTMVDEVVHEFNKPQKSFGGKLKKFAFSKFVEPKELHAQVPSFAAIIVARVFSQKSTKKIKNIANAKFEELADQTYDSTSRAIDAVTKHMFVKYNVINQQDFNKNIDMQLTEIRKTAFNYAYYILACLSGAMLLWVLLRQKPYLHSALFTMSLLVALLALIVGVTVSIIEVDARLSSLELYLMGEKLSFENQVLFYQSKSILAIAEALLFQLKPDSITVGVLILLFVILLPILRISARGLHMLCKPIIAENKVTRYLAFESGKWDMADVMVVGILMTYIGLNGILKSQLGNLNIKNEFLSTTTVNYSSIQPGYIIFVGYVVFAFFLSYVLKQIKTQCAIPDANPN